MTATVEPTTRRVHRACWVAGITMAALVAAAGFAGGALCLGAAVLCLLIPRHGAADGELVTLETGSI